MIDMKAGATLIALVWLLCAAGPGLAETSPPNLIGVWNKAVKIDVADPKAKDSRTQYDSGAMEFALTEQDGKALKGTATATGKQEPVTCEIQGNDRIACTHAGGVFQGEIYGTNELAGTYSANGATTSVLILRRKK